MQYSKRSLLFLLALIFQGCTSLFFYPDRITYRTPEHYDLAYDDLYFDSSDKVTLHAWHIYPEQESEGIMFLAHGNGQNLSSHFTAWTWLVKKGYELFIFDYRGYGKSGGETDIQGSIEDTKAALAYLEKTHTGDYFVCGQSLGATLLLNALEDRDNTKIKAVILDSAFKGFADIVNEKLALNGLTWPWQWVPYLTLNARYDADKKVQGIAKPILFLHGSSDAIISPNNSWQLFELSSMPKELWVVKKAEHIQSLENPQTRKDFLKFLQKDENYFNADYSRMRIYE